MFTEIVEALQAFGTEQNRKIYRRHGVGENQYGVSVANLKALRKKIKINHELALQLWETGNHDARCLAVMIADPQKADPDLLEKWGRDLSNYVITDALTSYVQQTPLLREKAEQWVKSDDEWIGTAGWGLLGYL
ncbi:MAG: DNA alkylation repair protein, partial [Anaerolineae bacterium]|nr:DNA alkylation repair protein [Anaerolineae bacterium]